MALRVEPTMTCENEAGRRYQLEIWREQPGQSANLDGRGRLVGLP